MELTEKQLTDRVYIIESPSIQNLTDGMVEGKTLYQALLLAGCDCNYSLVSAKSEFIKALEFVITDFFKKKGKLHAMPYIHISAHGNEHGIEFTDGTDMDWPEFSTYLTRINTSIGPILLEPGYPEYISRVNITLSTCEGYYAYRMYVEGKPCPFQAIVGPYKKVDWSDSLTAFIVFYHLVNFKHTGVDKAVEIMNTAAGLDDVFDLFIAPEVMQALSIQHNREQKDTD